MQFICLHFFQSEVKTYRRLRDIQGSDVPCIYGIVKYQTGSGLDFQSRPSSLWSQLFNDCPGILMEYVEGFSLNELSTKGLNSAPKRKEEQEKNKVKINPEEVSEH
jgi:hypothetical protein